MGVAWPGRGILPKFGCPPPCNYAAALPEITGRAFAATHLDQPTVTQPPPHYPQLTLQAGIPPTPDFIEAPSSKRPLARRAFLCAAPKKRARSCLTWAFAWAFTAIHSSSSSIRGIGAPSSAAVRRTAAIRPSATSRTRNGAQAGSPGRPVRNVITKLEDKVPQPHSAVDRFGMRRWRRLLGGEPGQLQQTM
jgi:hypothetical protein